MPYFNTASVSVTIPTPASSTRVDYIVLRANWTAQTVRITRVAGTEGAGAPSLTQSAGTTWDIPLATVSITTGGVITVTDARVYLSMVGDLAVTTAKLAADAVTNAKIADDSIDSEHYVDGSIDTAHVADGQITTAKLAADSVTNAKIADDQIDSEHYVDGSIDTAHIADGQITTVKLGADSVTNAKVADDPIDSEHYVDGSIDTAHIADDAVTADKVGDRVPQIHRRQGGSSSNWSTWGTTTYTPGAVRVQVGSVEAGYGTTGDESVTFPVAFSNVPLVICTLYAASSTSVASCSTTIISASGFTVQYSHADGAVDKVLHWLAIGPE